MDARRFAALEADLNKEFGPQKDWRDYLHAFQQWIEQTVLASVRRLASDAT